LNHIILSPELEEVVGVGGTKTNGVGIRVGEEAVVLVRKKRYNSYLTLQLGF